MTDYISRCQTCAYYNPQAHHCGRYLRGVETAVYLCHRIEDEEMKAVSEKEGVYGEYLND